MMTISFRAQCLYILLSAAACNVQPSQTGETGILSLTGPYLGQEVPGDVPELFAPGIVSTALYERDLVISPDGREIYFCVAATGFAQATIMVTSLTPKGWTSPEAIQISIG